MKNTTMNSENPLGLKSKKAAVIADKLLTKAFNEGRGQEMSDEIGRRLGKIKAWATNDAGHIAFIRALDKISKSPTLRIFNLKSLAEGRQEVLFDEAVQDKLNDDEKADIMKAFAAAPKPKYMACSK